MEIALNSRCPQEQGAEKNLSRSLCLLPAGAHEECFPAVHWVGGPLSADYLTDRIGANLDGMLAEYAVLSEEALVPMPSHLSFEEAATLLCRAVTA